MKRLTVAIFCVILIMTAALCPPAYAASPRYARAKNEEAYLYKKKDENPLFAIPYTYCVQILRDEGDWYFVRYADDAGVYEAIDGYCERDNFDLEYGTPEVTYLYRPVTLNLPAGEDLPFVPAATQLSLDAAYYGNVNWGNKLYAYVLCHGSFFYVKDDFGEYEKNLPAHTPDDNGGTESGGSGLNFATIAFIVITSLSVVVILVIYFTTKKPRVDG